MFDLELVELIDSSGLAPLIVRSKNSHRKVSWIFSLPAKWWIPSWKWGAWVPFLWFMMIWHIRWIKRCLFTNVSSSMASIGNQVIRHRGFSFCSHVLEGFKTNFSKYMQNVNVSPIKWVLQRCSIIFLNTGITRFCQIKSDWNGRYVKLIFSKNSWCG